MILTFLYSIVITSLNPIIVCLYLQLAYAMYVTGNLICHFIAHSPQNLSANLE